MSIKHQRTARVQTVEQHLKCNHVYRNRENERNGSKVFLLITVQRNLMELVCFHGSTDTRMNEQQQEV